MGSATPSRLGLTRVLDRATRSVQLKVKEALHIERTPPNTRLNRNRGYEQCYQIKKSKAFPKMSLNR